MVGESLEESVGVLLDGGGEGGVPVEDRGSRGDGAGGVKMVEDVGGEEVVGGGLDGVFVDAALCLFVGDGGGEAVEVVLVCFCFGGEVGLGEGGAADGEA